jgi:digalactosyldiacylglycerol synthase
MGNLATRPLDEEGTDGVIDDSPNALPASCASTSLSSEDEEDEEEEARTTMCSLSSGSSQCIPPVLSFYRKEGPLLVPPSDSGSDDEASESSSSSRGGPARRTSRKESSPTCSAHRRRRSWSPKPDQKISFFSKYSVGSSSTSSISSLIAKTKQQLITTGYNEEEKAMPDGHLPTRESDLNRLREYFIVTTAALPWFTGTAVNPLLRAAALSRYQRQQFTPERCTVTLVIPWLEVEEDRVELYGKDWKDKTQADQEAYIRTWLSNANMPEEALSPAQGGIRILFYPARYHSKMSSIFAMGDLCEFIVEQNNLTISEDAVCVLEEPEHVHFYRAQHWRDHFCHVVGIIHTNYKAYASTAMLAGSFITGPLIGTISAWLVRAYCSKVIKLSPVLQSFDCPEKEVVCNVHGIRHDFIQEGERRALEAQESGDSQDETKGRNKIYFIGKLLWAKGLDKLLDLEELYRNMTGDYFPIDIYGSGPEQDEIEQAFSSERSRFGMPYGNNALESATTSGDPPSPDATILESPSSNSANTTNSSSRRANYYSRFVLRPKPPVPANFKGREDHALLTGDYKIFVNPSITEVLCTTTAEATAMGKFVVIPDHPSNVFFHQFPNCLLYKSNKEFVDFLQYAITHNPEPLRNELINKLTWEAATTRFIAASAVSRRDAAWRERVGKTKSDEKLAKMHYELGKGAKGDVLRKVLGGGPVADQFQYELRMQQLDEDSLCPGKESSQDDANADTVKLEQSVPSSVPVNV